MARRNHHFCQPHQKQQKEGNQSPPKLLLVILYILSHFLLILIYFWMVHSIQVHPPILRPHIFSFSRTNTHTSLFFSFILSFTRIYSHNEYMSIVCWWWYTPLISRNVTSLSPGSIERTIVTDGERRRWYRVRMDREKYRVDNNTELEWM